AKKGRGYYAPYSEWEADVATGNPETDGNWTVKGRKSLVGWTLSYSSGRLAKVTAPTGRSADFSYDANGRLVAVSHNGTAFVSLVYDGALAKSVTVAGVATTLSYESRKLEILPRTMDGKVAHPVRPQLVLMKRGSLDAVNFGYEGNYLASISQGAMREDIAFEKAGRTARIVSDLDFSYSYEGGFALRDRAGRTARYSYDAKNGVFSISDFAGRKSTIYYFMRYDVAYLGKVRKIVDGEGKDLVSYRYDAKSGNVTRVRDRFGNDRDFSYDAEGRFVKATRRAHGERTIEPVASFAYGKGREPVAVSLLAADGTAALTTRLSRDKAGNVVSVDDGRGKAEVSYNRSGFPVSVRDPLGNVTKICYNDFNMPVSMTDANGIVTKYTCSDFGSVTRIERLDGSETLTSLSVAYDGAGRPVAYTDQDGLAKSFERDVFGKVLKEKFPDGSEVGYSYDALGRRTSVIDENGHEIRFGFGRFGLSSRTTAAGQLTDYVRDDLGLFKEVVSKWNGSEDRRITSKHDDFGRLVRADYGHGEVETFAYDKWNCLAKHTRGKTEETYRYDHFGRLVEKRENGLTTSYTYDAWGSRLSRVTKNRKGDVVSKENRKYDHFGRLAETAAGFGSKVTYAYDSKGRLARQVVDGSPIEYEYTKYGQLAGKHLGGKLNPDASVVYEYSKSGQIVARTANGVRQTYEYDKKGQLLAVKDADSNAVERYAYDKAGNMLRKTVNGKTTTFAFDDANQFVSSTTDGVTTRYAYDAAGRMVREGSKTYRYGYLDKVMSVTDGDTTRTYTYHADGQLARATCAAGNGSTSEDFLWDGLALVRRGDEQFVNEPHVGGGNPVASSKGTSYFNDALGTTVGSKSNGKYSAAALTAFGEGTDADKAFFTGKPMVEGLGHAFLMRNYRAGLAKWQTADPMGYPDGWNQLKYGPNDPMSGIDLLGCEWRTVVEWDQFESDDWTTVSGSSTDYQELWTLACRCGLSGWTRPYTDESMVEIIFNDIVSTTHNETDTWIFHKDIYKTVGRKTIEYGCICTTKNFKDKSVVDLILKFGIGIWVGRKGGNQEMKRLARAGMVGYDLDEIAREIWEKIKNYGQDEEFTIVFSSQVLEKTMTRDVGYFKVLVE
ncbi:MAG: RHS repeat protein, partial [Kiritimatiellae bacterium]|nr:RHS repeat protein [Kiritimatiellia bacterium]